MHVHVEEILQGLDMFLTIREENYIACRPEPNGWAEPQNPVLLILEWWKMDWSHHLRDVFRYAWADQVVTLEKSLAWAASLGLGSGENGMNVASEM